MSSENFLDKSSPAVYQDCAPDSFDDQPKTFQADINALEEILYLVKSEVSVVSEFIEIFGPYLKEHVDAFLKEPNYFTTVLLGMSFKVCSVLLAKDTQFLSTILGREFPNLCHSIGNFLRIHPLPSDDLLEAACTILRHIVTASGQNATFIAQKGFVNALLACILHQSPSLRYEAMAVIEVIYPLPGAVIDFTKLVKTSYRFLNLELQCQSTSDISERYILQALEMIESVVHQLHSLLVNDENRFYRDMTSLSLKHPHIANKIAASVLKIKSSCRIRRQRGVEFCASNSEKELDVPKLVPCAPSNLEKAALQEERKQTAQNVQDAQAPCSTNIQQPHPEVAYLTRKTPVLPSFPHNDTSRPQTYRRGAKVGLISDQWNDIQSATKLDDITSCGVARVICGMLNADQSGSIWFGFRQETGIIVDGIRITRDQKDEFRMGLHRVLTRISPLPLISAFSINFTQVEFLVGREVSTNTEHYIVEICVPKHMDSIYTTSDGKMNRCAYLRRGCNTEILSKKAVRSLVAQKEAQTYQKYIRTMERLLSAK